MNGPADLNAPQRAECLIEGRVQGVAYRKHAKVIGRALEIRGWVRNLDDGRVQVVAEGAKGDIARLIQFLWTGPELARVDHVDVRLGAAAGGEPATFEVRPNASSPEGVVT